MNRNPSIDVMPIKPQGILPPIGLRAITFRTVMVAGRKAFPTIDGLVYIDAQRAFFQVTGDCTVYSVAITAEEAESLGYNPSHNL